MKLVSYQECQIRLKTDNGEIITIDDESFGNTTNIEIKIKKMEHLVETSSLTENKVIRISNQKMYDHTVED